MKKLFQTILILTTMVGTADICLSQVVTAEQFKQIVAQQAEKDLQRYNLDDVEVSVGHIPVSSIELPDGDISVEVVTTSNTLMAREFRKININVNGKYAKTYYAPIETKAYKYVAVAKQIIQRDKVIPLQAVEYKKVNVVGNLNNTLDSNDIAKEIVATKVFYPGDIITKRFTVSKPDIVKNAMVTVNFKTGSNINVAIDGIALMQGNIGDFIQVKNKRFNKIYTGEVVGINQVLVQI